MGSPYSKLAPVSAAAVLAPTVFAAAPPGQKLLSPSLSTDGTYISNAPSDLDLEHLGIDLLPNDGQHLNVKLTLFTPGMRLTTVSLEMEPFDTAITESDRKLKSEGCVKPKGSYNWHLQWDGYPPVGPGTIALCPGIGDEGVRTVRIILNRAAYGTQGVMISQLHKSGKEDAPRIDKPRGLRTGEYVYSSSGGNALSEIRITVPDGRFSERRSGNITFTVVENGQEYSTAVWFASVRQISSLRKSSYMLDTCFAFHNRGDGRINEIKMKIYPGKDTRHSMMLCVSADQKALLLYPDQKRSDPKDTVFRLVEKQPLGPTQGSKRGSHPDDKEEENIKKVRKD